MKTMSSQPQQQQQHQQQHRQAELPPHSPDPELELPRVLLALQAVYAPSSTSAPSSSHGGADSFDRRDVADRYLTSFQRAPVAWMVCDRLLSDGGDAPTDASNDANSAGLAAEDPTLRTQRQFFAAQTLHAKCLGDVHQLPPSSLPSLRDSLLSHFVRHAGDAARAQAENRPASRPLVTRLSMAIAALAVHMGWTSGLTDVTELVLRPNPHLGPAVLELFRSMPEEADSSRLVMTTAGGDGGGDDGCGGGGGGGGGGGDCARTATR